MSVLTAIGNTPIVELKTLNRKRPHVRIFAKMECCNPGGSVKDRAALYMIKNAESTGKLTKEKTILEASSGNTGIALAMIGAAKGYKVKLLIPDCVSEERKKVLEVFGAEVILTPGEEGTDGAIRRALEIMEKEPEKYFMPNQFENESNPLAHYETTGPEIFSQTSGKIDALVAGMGTTGTLMGTGRFLKEKNPDLQIVGVEPERNHTIQGLKNMSESIVPKIYNPGLLDEKVTVGDEEAFEITRQLATKEGLFVGMSSGAAVAGALHFAKRLSSGRIVVILPDRGERYLSTTLFRSVCGKCPP